MNKTLIYRIDWIIIFCYLILVVFGLINIYSSTYDNETSSNLNSLIGKQIIFLLISISFGIFILGIRTRFFQQFSFIIYMISLLSLIGLFIFGQTVNGANSWYFLGGISVQPSEFAKIATTFMIAKHLSGFQTNIKNKKSLIMGVFIILLPVSLIIMQPDPGSAIIFCSFFLIFFREGLSFNYLILTFSAIGLFLVTL
jgi:rod shape determining protein RodA